MGPPPGQGPSLRSRSEAEAHPLKRRRLLPLQVHTTETTWVQLESPPTPGIHRPATPSQSPTGWTHCSPGWHQAPPQGTQGAVSEEAQAG